MSCFRAVVKNIGFMIAFMWGLAFAVVAPTWGAIWTTHALSLPDLAGLPIALLYVSILIGSALGIYECRRSA